MLNTKINKDFMKIFIVIWLIFVLTLSIISFIDWSYLTGFVLGSLFSVISFWINELLFGVWLSKRKSFKTMFLISMIKYLIWTIVLSGLIIAILFLNKTYNQKSNDLMDWCSGVFNIFLFIVGSSILFLTIIIYHIAEPIMKGKKNIRKGE